MQSHFNNLELALWCDATSRILRSQKEEREVKMKAWRKKMADKYKAEFHPVFEIDPYDWYEDNKQRII